VDFPSETMENMLPKNAKKPHQKSPIRAFRYLWFQQFFQVGLQTLVALPLVGRYVDDRLSGSEAK
jgi:hypothetical protein